MNNLDINDLVRKYDLAEEVTIAQAAKVLEVSYHTVRRYVERGDLPARDAAVSGSSQKAWRIPLSAVVEMRTDYDRPIRKVEKAKKKTVTQRVKTFKHIKMD